MKHQISIVVRDEQNTVRERIYLVPDELVVDAVRMVHEALATVDRLTRETGGRVVASIEVDEGTPVRHKFVLRPDERAGDAFRKLVWANLLGEGREGQVKKMFTRLDGLQSGELAYFDASDAEGILEHKARLNAAMPTLT